MKLSPPANGDSGKWAFFQADKDGELMMDMGQQLLMTGKSGNLISVDKRSGNGEITQVVKGEW